MSPKISKTTIVAHGLFKKVSKRLIRVFANADKLAQGAWNSNMRDRPNHVECGDQRASHKCKSGVNFEMGFCVD